MHRFDLRNATPPGTAHSFSGSFEVQTVGGRWRRTGLWGDIRKSKKMKTPRRWSPGCRRPAPWWPGPRSADTPRCGWRGSERCPGRSGTEAGGAGRYFLPGNPPRTTDTGVRLSGNISVQWVCSLKSKSVFETAFRATDSINYWLLFIYRRCSK